MRPSIDSDRPTPRPRFEANVWIGFFVANLLSLSLCAFFAAQSHRQIEQRTADLASNLLQGISHSISSNLDQIRMADAVLVANLERSLRLGAIDVSQATHLARSFEFTHPDRDSMRDSTRVIDATGMLLIGAGSTASPPHNFSDRAYFRFLKANLDAPTFISKPLVGKVSKKPILLLATSYKNPDGSFAGVITDSILLASIEPILRPATAQAGDIFSLIDSRDSTQILQQTSMGATRPPRRILGDPANLSLPISPILAQALSTSSSGRIPHFPGADGAEQYLVFSPLPDTPYIVVAGLLRQTHFAPWRELVSLLSIFSLVFLFLSAFVIHALLAHEKRMLCAERTRDALNSDLEDKVALRTHDLEAALDRIRQSRSELAEAERLASLGAMVAGVAHELNTPLGNALLTATTLQNEAAALSQIICAPAGSPLRKSDLLVLCAKIHALSDLQTQSIARAAGLVRSFKQVALDQASATRREFNLREALEGVAASYRPTLDKSGGPDIKLEIDCPDSIVCDSFPGALMQISTNMLQNAQRHGFDGRASGHIRITCRQVEAPSGPQANISYEDDGVGMAPEIAEHAFEQFFTTKSGQNGYGIGLSLSRQLAESALRGSLVFSPQAEGCSFTLAFPLIRP